MFFIQLNVIAYLSAITQRRLSNSAVTTTVLAYYDAQKSKAINCCRNRDNPQDKNWIPILFYC